MAKPQPGDPKYDKKALEVEEAIRKFFTRKVINNLDTNVLKKLKKTFYKLLGEFDDELYEKIQQSVGGVKGSMRNMKRKLDGK
jgi:hypothetical protein